MASSEPDYNPRWEERGANTVDERLYSGGTLPFNVTPKPYTIVYPGEDKVQWIVNVCVGKRGRIVRIVVFEDDAPPNEGNMAEDYIVLTAFTRTRDEDGQVDRWYIQFRVGREGGTRAQALVALPFPEVEIFGGNEMRTPRRWAEYV